MRGLPGRALPIQFANRDDGMGAIIAWRRSRAPEDATAGSACPRLPPRVCIKREALQAPPESQRSRGQERVRRDTAGQEFRNCRFEGGYARPGRPQSSRFPNLLLYV